MQPVRTGKYIASLKEDTGSVRKLMLLILLAVSLAAATASVAEAASSTRSGKMSSLPGTAYLFSYFINNGEDGLHLAWSVDGLNWTALNGDKSFLKPEAGESRLMRDPCLVYCPDKVFRMVWTTSWGGCTVGYASSKDLITWSGQQAIPVGEADKTDNCWAPELFYDAATKQYVIFWSSTVSGRFPQKPEEVGDGNHRTYYTTTRDFKTFAPTKLFFDPGFNCIDTTMIKANGKYHLIFKDERPKPVWQKNLRTAEGPTALGPWSNISEPFSRHGVEGPSVLKIGDYYVCYFDGFAGGGYGAMKTRDFITWEEQSDRLVVPPGTKHGTAFAVPGRVIEKLIASGMTDPNR